MQVYVEKNFRRVFAGEIANTQDCHGNPTFLAARCDGQSVTFYNKGAAEHWLRLGGLLHG